MAFGAVLVALAVATTACEVPESEGGKLAEAPTTAPTSAPAAKASTKPGAAPSTAPPAPAPKAVPYSGRGDKVLKLSIGDDPYALVITHRGSSNFAVEQLDAGGKMTDLLVNAIGSYAGTVAVNFEDGEQTAALKITADGSWTVKVTPLALLRKWDASKPITGKGDDVFLLTEAAFGGLDSAKVTHRGSGNFAVQTYDADGDYDLAVNEIGRYDGEIQVGDETLAVVVTADGAWSFAKT